MSVKQHLPNFVTLLNLACGVAACIVAFHQQPYWAESAALLLVGAAIADLFDGLLARALRVESPMGAQLDSLADLVSFGLAPALMLHAHLRWDGEPLWAWAPLVLPLFAAWRLARFNVRHDIAPSDTFEGLPTPANGLYVAALVLAVKGPLYMFLPMPLLGALVLLQGILMVSNVPFMALKGKGWSFQLRWPLYALLGLSLAAILWLGIGAAPVILVLYLVFSLLAARLVRA